MIRPSATLLLLTVLAMTMPCRPAFASDGIGVGATPDPDWCEAEPSMVRFGIRDGAIAIAPGASAKRDGAKPTLDGAIGIRDGAFSD